MKQIFALNIGTLIIGILIDQGSKFFAPRFFEIVKNHGLFLNSLETLPEALKLMTLATSASVFFFLYLVFLYLINDKLKAPRFATSLLMSGVLSNTLDKALLGHTIDFIPFSRHAFNLADVFVVGSGVYLLCMILRKHDELWFPQDARTRVLVNPKAQMMFGLKAVVLVLCTSLFLGAFSYSYIQTSIRPQSLVSDQLIANYVILHVAMTILFSGIAFIVGLFVSQRFVGPIVALERFVNDLKEGDDKELKLRQGDYFKQLEKLGQKISELKKGSDLE